MTKIEEIIASGEYILGERTDKDNERFWKLTFIQPPPVVAEASLKEGDTSYTSRINMLQAIVNEATARDYPEDYPFILTAEDWNQSRLSYVKDARNYILEHST